MKQIISGSYTLIADDSWRLGQLQEIYLQCDTTFQPVNIDLFEIIDLDGFWNVKIFISDPGLNASTNNITINSTGSDSIDSAGNGSVVIETDGASVELQIVSDNQWIATKSVNLSGLNYLVNRVTIKQAALQTLGSFPVTILPGPSAGNVNLIAYYDLWFSGTLYGGLTFQNYLEISQALTPNVGVNRTMIGYPGFGSLTKDNYLRVYPGTGLYADPSLYVQPNDFVASGAVIIKMAKTIAPFFTDPTGGGGTLVIDTYYTQKIFGSL